MRVFLDANVLLDVAFERQPFVEDSQAVLDWCAEHADATLIAWHSITNAYYLLRKPPIGDEGAREFLKDLLAWIDVAPTSKAVALNAINTPGGDLEDHLQALCAEQASADVIVTRNEGDFQGAQVRVVSPRIFLQQLPSI